MCSPSDRPMEGSYGLVLLLDSLDMLILFTSIVLANNLSNTSSTMLTLVIKRNSLSDALMVSS